MNHGAPLTSAEGEGVGHAGPFMLDVGISSTLEIARFFGLVRTPTPYAEGQAQAQSRPAKQAPAPAENSQQALLSGVEKTIAEALRKAGLLR
jgi:hypothetical protein